MNKCCDNCANHNTKKCMRYDDGFGGVFHPFKWVESNNSCNEYTPKPEPGKIEPLVFHSHSDMVDKINEIIAVVNRRDK